MKKLLLTLLVVLVIPLARGAETLPQVAERVFKKPAVFEKGELKQVQGIALLILEGKPEEMGRQYGNLLGEVLRRLEIHLETRVFTNVLQKTMAYALANEMGKNLPPHYQQELRAMARAAEVKYESLLVINSLAEIFNVGCSTFSVWSKRSADGKPMLGRNLDFYTWNAADRLSMVVVYKPEGRRAFAAPTIVGLAGAYSGMNSDGLAIANMLAYNVKNGLGGGAIPSVFAYRQVLEECSTVEEACNLLKKQTHLGGQNLMVLSAAGKSCVVEMDNKNVFVRKPTGKFLYATNHFVSPQMASQRVNCGRYKKLVQALEYTDDALDLEQAKELVRKTATRGLNLQAMVIRPATREIHLACGKEPAADQPFKTIKLQPYLKAEKSKVEGQKLKDENKKQQERGQLSDLERQLKALDAGMQPWAKTLRDAEKNEPAKE